MKIILGGTFDIIHKGHITLIKKAFNLANKNDVVYIGLSDVKLIEEKISVKPYSKRKTNLENFIKNQKYEKNFEIIKITDIFGPTLNQDFDIIVVSEETYQNAVLINKERIKINKKPIKIVKIPYILAEDSKPISTTRIKNKEIDRFGKKI